MKVKLCTVFDSKVSVWSTPLPFKHSGDALRWFQDQVNRKDERGQLLGNIAKYPADHSLFELGTFCENDCKFDLLFSPVCLSMAIELVNQ